MTERHDLIQAHLLPFESHTPVLARDVYIARGAQVIGDVELGAGSSVWFNAVIRGDVMPIRIGQRTNIQDLSMLHTSTDVAPTHVGDDVTVGHRAILHGCTVDHGCLIGMGAIILDGAHIGDGSLVAAGALVPPRMKVPPHSFVIGSPARIKRQTTPEEREAFLQSAAHYAELAQRYLTP